MHYNYRDFSSSLRQYLSRLLPYLIIFLNIQSLHASIGEDGAFYNLDNPQIIQASIARTPYLGNAFYVSDPNSVTDSIINHARTMVCREKNLRDYCEKFGTRIATDRNIAQLSFHVVYNVPAKDPTVIEQFTTSSCRGIFYLSGNEPTTFLAGADKAPKGNSVIDIQKLTSSEGNGFVEIKQRRQPHIGSVETIVTALSNNDTYIFNFSEVHMGLKNEAQVKKKEIETFKDNREQLLEEIQADIVLRKQIVNNLQNPENVSAMADVFTLNILEEILTALEADDYSFYSLSSMNKNPGFKKLAERIMKKLTPRSLNDVFNSKHFNLGCSEPLLLLELQQEMRMTTFKREFLKTVGKNEVGSVYIHLHSTKMPCKSCFISCAYHAKEGVIQQYRSLIRECLKKENMPVYFIITYNEDYQEAHGYQFYLPVMQQQEITDQLLILKSN